MRTDKKAQSVIPVAIVLIAAGVALVLGIFVFSKVGNAAELITGVGVNSTDYCAGEGAVWNGSDCTTGTLTALPTNFAAENATIGAVRDNVLDALDLAGIGLIVLAIAVVVGYLVILGRK